MSHDPGYLAGIKAALMACELVESSLTHESTVEPSLWRNIAGAGACVAAVSGLISERAKATEHLGTDLLLESFRSIRADVDCDNLLDTFDLALGWLMGLGVAHGKAADLAGEWANLQWE